MGYADNSFKFVVVVNKKHQAPRLLNAALHLAAGMVGRADDATRQQMQFLAYTDASGATRAWISKYPFIVLEARNANQLRVLRQAAFAAGVAYADFVDAMLDTSAEAQLAATASGTDDTLDVLAACLWGPATVLDPLTRRFSLLRSDTRSEPTATGEPS
jgi:hypothetical protein